MNKKCNMCNWNVRMSGEYYCELCNVLYLQPYRMENVKVLDKWISKETDTYMKQLMIEKRAAIKAAM